MIFSDDNFELMSRETIFSCDDYKTLASLSQKMTHNCAEEAKRKIEHSKHFDDERLNSIIEKYLIVFFNK